MKEMVLKSNFLAYVFDLIDLFLMHACHKKKRKRKINNERSLYFQRFAQRFHYGRKQNNEFTSLASQ